MMFSKAATYTLRPRDRGRPVRHDAAETPPRVSADRRAKRSLGSTRMCGNALDSTNTPYIGATSGRATYLTIASRCREVRLKIINLEIRS